MTKSKRSRGVALPPIDASPEEIAQAIFAFNPDSAPLEEDQAQAHEPRLGEVLSIKVQKGSPTHRVLEDWETEARRRAEEQSA